MHVTPFEHEMRAFAWTDRHLALLERLAALGAISGGGGDGGADPRRELVEET